MLEPMPSFLERARGPTSDFSGPRDMVKRHVLPKTMAHLLQSLPGEYQAQVYIYDDVPFLE